MNNKTKNILSLIFNIGMAILVFISIRWFFSDEGQLSGVGNMAYGGYGCFIFFTNDSNILAAICSLFVVPFNIKNILTDNNYIPKWVVVFKFIGTCAVTLTLMVVLLFLGPITGYASMFERCCLYLHLFCPLISIISFCFFEKGFIFNKKYALLGVLPTFLYGNVYLINVIFRQTWTDFYHFNIGGYWYISYVVLHGFTYLLAFILTNIHNKYEMKGN